MRRYASGGAGSWTAVHRGEALAARKRLAARRQARDRHRPKGKRRPRRGRPLGCVVLAAGLGTRMRSATAKVLHLLGGRPLLEYVLAAIQPLSASPVVVVVGHQADRVREACERAWPRSRGRELRFAVQRQRRGTGHAVACALRELEDFRGDLLLLYGDVPGLRTETLERLVGAHRREHADLSLVTARFSDPSGYGRIVRGPSGAIERIVEEKDASAAERAITEVNPGVYCARSEFLVPAVAGLRPENAQGEYYLTDVLSAAIAEGRKVAAVEATGASEVMGVNSRRELAEAEKERRCSVVARWMEAGVTFEDPATAYVEDGVKIGRDTVIGPNTQLRGRTTIGRGCRIDGSAFLVDTKCGPGVHLKFGVVATEAELAAGVEVGPFAHLRPGTRLGPRVRIGNFVETKKATIGAGTKANHLTYLGDVTIGPETNVGAGTITCNYDGFRKNRTVIGARVQIGSDTQLVAPVEVGDDAYVGAGTTVTRDVPAGALAVSRVPQHHVEGWVARRRERERERMAAEEQGGRAKASTPTLRRRGGGRPRGSGARSS